jgi:hypothetical protein
MSYKGTKRQIAQSIQDYLANGTASSEKAVDIRDIYIQLDRITNKYAKLGLFANMQMGDRNVSDVYMVTFEAVKIVKDRRRDECYSILPSRIMDLPGGRGVDAVYPSGNRSKSLTPVPRNFLSSFKRSLIKKKDRYWIEDANKIVYSTDYDVSGIQDVDVRMPCPGAESIDPDAIYPIDKASESEIINEVIAHFFPNERRGQDSVADNRRTPSSGTFDPVK